MNLIVNRLEIGYPNEESGGTIIIAKESILDKERIYLRDRI